MKTAKQWLSDNGYGTGTNFTFNGVADLMDRFIAELHSPEPLNLRSELIRFFDWYSGDSYDINKKLIDRYLSQREVKEPDKEGYAYDDSHDFGSPYEGKTVLRPDSQWKLLNEFENKW